MLFTASHGLGWPLGHPDQRQAQGSLLAQDWARQGPVSPAEYFSGADVEDNARLHGLVGFFFACYSVGTPDFDACLIDRNRGPIRISDQAFVSALAQRLLSHPRGGALAVIGHVDRAWGFSIKPRGLGAQLEPYRNLINRILTGEPVGHATRDFSLKYAILSADLLLMLDRTKPGPRPDDEELAWTWIACNDAQNYIVLGDPAVRIRVDHLH
jgi:hypothetical protein